jgi:hypothetical protein
MGVAVSTGTSCLSPTNPTGQVGAVAGVLSSTQGGAVAGATVTATSDSGGAFVATSDAGGNYLITGIPDGSGSISVAAVPSNCATPTAVNYTVTTTDTTMISFTITCGI